MKKLLHVLCFFTLLSFSSHVFAQRFLTEVFSSTTVTSNVIFGQNVQFLTGSPVTVNLKADVYEPVGDTMSARPAIIVLHTGSFIPIFYNGQTTGIKTDSTITEMCRQFARRGYTAIAMDYRLGWNPTALGAAGQDIRTGSLLQAVYRAIQDAKACVRYFRNDANNANTYHINPNEFILGGAGTGGYIALAYATLNNPAQISLPKFLAATSNASYGFTAGQSYINQAIWGDFDGYGGTTGYNIATNTPGVSNAINFAFNMGGALGDSSWLVSGNVPMVCFHVVNDPFAPYADGPVIVPVTGDFVVDVSGSYTIVRRADSLQNNMPFQTNAWTDPFTTRANQVNGGYDGLCPFILPPPPFASGQAGPWEWYDSTTCFQTMMFGLGFTQGHADTVWYNSLGTNPDMSSAKGHAYVDTIMGYLNPRIASAMQLVTGIQNTSQLNSLVNVFPNPASDYFQIGVSDYSNPIQYVNVYDITGRTIYDAKNIKSVSYRVDTKSLDAGVYLLKIGFDKGEVIRKITVN
ncbi:MAG: T9SS type A sorting domain-containing protein [Bacteroidetes bacterium]|nr:T9SS type A sorting domain-containing protein [Bacteroidota bacterium]